MTISLRLVAVYDAQGKYDDALKFYGKVIEIFEKVLGIFHPDTNNRVHKDWIGISQASFKGNHCIS